MAGWPHTGDCPVGRVGSSLLLLTLAPWGALGAQIPPGRLGTQRSCRAEADGIFYPQTGILKDFTSHLLALSCGPFLVKGQSGDSIIREQRRGGPVTETLWFQLTADGGGQRLSMGTSSCVGEPLGTRSRGEGRLPGRLGSLKRLALCTLG